MEYGLLGERLSHSYSKPIHNLLGEYEYDLINISREDIKDFLLKREFSGLNVTIPYKQTVIPFCAKLSKTAERVGSVNTITIENGNLIGHNTDYLGFLYMLKKVGIKPMGKKALVLGSGGTCLTARAVLSDLGAQVIIVSRSGEINYSNIYTHSDCDIIVNTTPVGMYPNNGETLLDLNRFPKCSGVIDVIYNPLYTRLLQSAIKSGIPCANGLSMLVAQAKYASDLFQNKLTSEDTLLSDNNDYDEIIEAVIKRMTADFTSIILTGMPGSGKSCVGKLIAEITGRGFFDTDTLIEEKEGISIPEIFEKHGEEYFRNIEQEIIAEVTRKAGRVISTGGGGILREENRFNLKQNGFIAFINRDLNSLETENRPLLKRISLQELYNQRLPIYKDFCDIQAENNKTAEECAKAILEAMFNEY